MQRLLMVMAAAALMLTGCSDDKAGGTAMKEKAPAAPATAAAPAAPAKPKLPAGAIDHTRDVKEFELRRSLGGVERMISTYEEAGHDTTELKARKAKLEQELGKLLG